MNASFKPRVEMLEDRTVMSTAGIADLTSIAIDPAAHVRGTPIVSVTDLVIDPFNAGTGAVSGRVTGIVADPTDAASTSQFDPEWRYVPIRRTALVEDPASMDSQDGNVIFVSTQGGGVWKSTDGGGRADRIGPFFEFKSQRLQGAFKRVAGLKWETESIPGVGDDSRSIEDNSHGPHVADTIGAVGNNGVPASHELGHTLGFRHEHTRPS